MKRIVTFILPLVILAGCSILGGGKNNYEKCIQDGKCTRHNVELVGEIQQIVYGLPYMSSKYWDYHYEYFPNYEPFIEGGCFCSEDLPKEGYTEVCLKCKEEYLKLKDEIDKKSLR